MTTVNLPGTRVRAAFNASTAAILGYDNVPTESRGQAFYTSGFFSFLRAIGEAYGAGNQRIFLDPPVEKRKIVIAETPDEVPPFTFAALRGGGYHEAFHQKWTRQGGLRPHEIEAAFRALGGFRLKHPRFQAQTVSRTMNLFEDVLIERAGRAEYPGVIGGLEALSDFILIQEGRITKPAAAAQVYIRELGFGYETERNTRRLDEIRSDFPGIALMVERRFGNLIADLIAFDNSPVNIRRMHDGASLTMALDFLSAIEALVDDAASLPPPRGGEGPAQKSKGPGEPQKGEGEPQKGPGEPGDGEPQKGESEPGAEGEPGGAGAGEEKPGEGEPADKPGGGEPAEDEPQKGEPGKKRRPSDVGGRDMGLNEVKTSNDALSNGVKEFKLTAPKKWRPQSTSDDKLVRAKPGAFAPDPEYKAVAAPLRDAFLRRFRAQTETDTEYGVRRGAALSSRNLVNTVASIRGGEDPTRAFDRTDEVEDITVAAAIVVDQSGSMSGHVSGVASMAFVLMDTLSKIGGKTMIVGFDGDGDGHSHSGVCHRTHPVTYTLFKSWDQPAGTGARALATMKASGSTPTSDGIQIALDALRHRREKKKVIFVVTDGAPNSGQAPVVQDQIRTTPYPIVGVGIGNGGAQVKALFKHGAYGATPRDLVADLIKILNRVI
jgi:hypothetical protein